jgi:hypothetical protein
VPLKKLAAFDIPAALFGEIRHAFESGPKRPSFPTACPICVDTHAYMFFPYDKNWSRYYRAFTVDRLDGGSIRKDR